MYAQLLMHICLEGNIYLFLTTLLIMYARIYLRLITMHVGLYAYVSRELQFADFNCLS